MHKKKYSIFCKRRLGKILALITLVFGLIVALNTSTQIVSADDAPQSMNDVAGHYSNAGLAWSIIDKKDNTYQDKAVKPWQKVYSVWNFLGSGKQSILSKESIGQRGATYSALRSSVATPVRDSVEDAALYSYAMSQSGLDHPTSGGTDFIHRIGRYIVGLASIAMMYISYLASQFLHLVFKLFKWINPFYVLQNLTTNTPAVAKNSIFGKLIEELKPIYQQLSNISVGILLTSLFAGITMAVFGLRSQGHQEGLGTNIAMKVLSKSLRIIAIFMVPVLIGVTSAQLTDDIDNSMDVTSDISLKEIYGNFVNFSAWATHSRLALPNEATMGGKLSKTDQLNSTGTNPFSEEYINAINAYGAGMRVPAKIAQGGKKSTLSDVSDTANMLWNYINADGINGNAWNGTFKARLRKRISNMSGDKLSQQGVNSSKDANISKSDALKNPYQAVAQDIFGDYGNKGNYDNAQQCMFFKDGSLDSYHPKSGGTYFKSNAPKKASSSDLAAIGSSDEAGLSSIGLYNYLNVDGGSGSHLNYTTPDTFTGLQSVNQHANVGFVGRGLLAAGTFFKMIAMIASSGLVVAFAGVIVIKGVLSNIPRILVYAAKLVTGNLKAIISVGQEMIEIYARIIVGGLIVYLFQGMLPSICNKLESMLIGSISTSTIQLNSVNMLPFAGLDANALGVVRFIESVFIWLIMYAIVKSYRDVLKFINGLLDHVIEQFKHTSFGSKVLPSTPMPNTGGFNNMSNNNANTSSNLNNDNNGFNTNNPYDTPDSADDLRKAQKDPEQNQAHTKPSFGESMKSQTMMAGMDVLDAFTNSPTGKVAKKAAAAIGGTLGGTKLGDALNLKSRADGLQAADKAEQKLRQNMAMAADPLHANNTAKAGMSKAERKANDVHEARAGQVASAAALKQAQKEQAAAKQAKQDILDQFKPAGLDANGKQKSELKDAAAVGGVVSALAAQNALSPKAKLAANKAEELAKKAQQANQKRTQRLEEAVNDAQEAYAQNPTPENKKRLQAATAQLHQSQLMSDPSKRALFEHANRKAVTPTALGLRPATNKDLDQARMRRFTALTGKDAATSAKATPEQLERANNVARGAKKILADENASEGMRQKAAEDLQTANVVLETGRQFGPYMTKSVASNLKNASGNAIADAKKYQQIDHATLATNMVATNKAPKLSPAELNYAKRVDNARNVVATGQIMHQGQPRLATVQEIEQAKGTLTSDPAKQVSRIQGNMMSTTSMVMSQARQYSNQIISEAKPGTSPSELSTMRQDAVTEYLQKPQIQQQLRASGLVNTNNPTALQEQINRVQKLDQTMRTGLNESLVPIRQQIAQMPDMPNHEAIRQAGEQKFNQLYASSRLVDSTHYKITTNEQVERATHRLLNAYHTKDMDQIRDAREKAAKIGMANPIINSQKKLQEASRQMQEQRSQIINTASQPGKLSNDFVNMEQMMKDYGVGVNADTTAE